METVRIERFTSRVHAELACSMLVSHGINARVSGDDVGGVHPDIPYGIGGTAVVVPTEQLEEATALLDDRFDGQLGDVDDEVATPEPDGITAARRGAPGAPGGPGAPGAPGAPDAPDAPDAPGEPQSDGGASRCSPWPRRSSCCSSSRPSRASPPVGGADRRSG